MLYSHPMANKSKEPQITLFNMHICRKCKGELHESKVNALDGWKFCPTCNKHYDVKNSKFVTTKFNKNLTK